MRRLTTLLLSFVVALVVAMVSTADAATPKIKNLCVWPEPQASQFLAVLHAIDMYNYKYPAIKWKAKMLGSIKSPDGVAPPVADRRSTVTGFLANGTDCDAIVGPLFSHHTVVLSPLVTVPWIDGGASSTELSDKAAYPSFSRVVVTDAVAAVSMVRVLEHYGWTTLNLLCVDEAYGRSVTQGVSDGLLASGGVVERSMCISQQATYAEALFALNQFRQSKSRALFVGAPYGPALISLVQAINDTRAHEDMVFLFGEGVCAGLVNLHLQVPGSLCYLFGVNETRFQPFRDSYAVRDNTAVVNELITNMGWWPSQITDKYFRVLGGYHPFFLDATTHMMSAFDHVERNGLGNASNMIQFLRQWESDGVTGTIQLDHRTGDRLYGFDDITMALPNGTAIKLGTVVDDRFTQSADSIYVFGKYYGRNEQVPSIFRPMTPPNLMSNGQEEILFALIAGALTMVLLLGVGTRNKTEYYFSDLAALVVKVMRNQSWLSDADRVLRRVVGGARLAPTTTPAGRHHHRAPLPRGPIDSKEQLLVVDSAAEAAESSKPPQDTRIGIIGGGMGGMYAAILLQQQGYQNITIYEADPQRVGGRVFTHRFSDEPNQYFEAGAMRFPNIAAQQPVFDLICWLNNQPQVKSKITRGEFPLTSDGNFAFVNFAENDDGSLITLNQADKNPTLLKFPAAYSPREPIAAIINNKADGASATSEKTSAALPGIYMNKSAKDMMDEVLAPYLATLGKASQRVPASITDPSEISKFIADREKDFEAAYNSMLKYDNYSMRAWLKIVQGWSEAQVNYCETMLSQSNQFDNSFTELCIELADFGTAKWYTIDDGMDHLPNACADYINRDRFVMGARVTDIIENPDTKKITLKLNRHADNQPRQEEFDRVIVALPPYALNNINCPQWSVQKRAAIRNTRFEQLVKVGLRFKTRFWEQDPRDVQAFLKSIGCTHFNPNAKKRYNKCQGGQSTTDLPSRWFVYPPFAIGSDGPGTMMTYSWMTDGAHLSSLDDAGLKDITLRDFKTVYGDGICFDCLYMEHHAKIWADQWSGGDAMFGPGQFTEYLEPMRCPEGNVFFVGEHLSLHHTWIVGAMESAKLAVAQIVGEEVGYIPGVQNCAHESNFCHHEFEKEPAACCHKKM